MDPESQDGDETTGEALAPEIYQAQGAVAVDLGIGVTEAMAHMKAHAITHELSLLAVAVQILANEVVIKRAAD